jgi:hypothetical protein
MKKLITAVLMAAAICLGGCASTGGTMSTADIQAFEDMIIADAVAVCKFEPTVATVAGLVATAVVPGAAAITSVAAGLANSICASVTVKSAARGAVLPPMVNGVVIRGHFVG